VEKNVIMCHQLIASQFCDQQRRYHKVMLWIIKIVRPRSNRALTNTVYVIESAQKRIKIHRQNI
jgi:hypothetical protein